jgi:phosphoenolpyruvate-protein kinase (PTS system EI component)
VALSDPQLRRALCTALEGSRDTSESAIASTFDKYHDKMQAADTPYLSEWTRDLAELKQRLLKQLANSASHL